MQVLNEPRGFLLQSQILSLEKTYKKKKVSFDENFRWIRLWSELKLWLENTNKV